jgi:hypothetical protein
MEITMIPQQNVNAPVAQLDRATASGAVASCGISEQMHTVAGFVAGCMGTFAHRTLRAIPYTPQWQARQAVLARLARYCAD